MAFLVTVVVGTFDGRKAFFSARRWSSKRRDFVRDPLSSFSLPPLALRVKDVLALIDEMAPSERARLLVAPSGRYDADGQPKLGVNEELHRLRR